MEQNLKYFFPEKKRFFRQTLKNDRFFTKRTILLQTNNFTERNFFFFFERLIKNTNEMGRSRRINERKEKNRTRPTVVSVDEKFI